MANWIIQLDVSDIWESAEEDMKGFLEKLLPRLQEILPKVPNTDLREELVFIIQRLTQLKFSASSYEDPQDVFYEFNDIWSDFYDWCDRRIRPGQPLCWVKNLPVNGDVFPMRRMF
jgi:hypothetical protein